MQVYPPNPQIDPLPFFSQPDACQEKLFQYKMLASPLRQIVITKIKDPLRKALTASKSFPSLVLMFISIVLTAWRIRKYVGKVTKFNSVFKNVHTLLDLAELVDECLHKGNTGNRGEMINSSLEVVIAIIEHDPFYRHIAYLMGDYIIKQAEMGNWIKNDEPAPKSLRACWDDNRFKEGMNNGNHSSN